MQVRVVNSYAAIRDSVSVSLVRRVDLPTDGKPIKPTRESPDLVTSKPVWSETQLGLMYCLENSRTLSCTAAFARRGDKFSFEFGKLSLEQTNMLHGSLILLGPGHLFTLVRF